MRPAVCDRGVAARRPPRERTTLARFISALRSELNKLNKTLNNWKSFGNNLSNFLKILHFLRKFQRIHCFDNLEHFREIPIHFHQNLEEK
jgi:hypothetical protein